MLAARSTRPDHKRFGRLVLLDGAAKVPLGFPDLDAFCDWVRSKAFPERGRFSFLRGELWADLDMEQLFFQNLLKLRIGSALDQLMLAEQTGYYFTDGVLLRNDDAELATEPDGLFVSKRSIDEGRAVFVRTTARGYVRIDGSPDMVLEIVSDSSVRKDTVELRELYWLAGVREYWLVDARIEAVRFDILKRGRKGFSETRKSAGEWVKSEVFGRTFRIASSTDDRGFPQFLLEMKK